jgi:ubiquinone/menaquinone biosynthesis C-methylase UbiE
VSQFDLPFAANGGKRLSLDNTDALLMPNPIEERILIDGRVCPWWFAYTFDNPLRRWLHNPRKILGAYVREGDTAIDIGCGMGPFTAGLARLVGSNGRVIAVDLQEEMLQRVKTRVTKAGLADRVELHRCQPESLGLAVAADFILAFWMAHEAPEAGPFFEQIAGLLKEGGRFLLVEPKGHVGQDDFQHEVEAVQAAGLSVKEWPKITISRAALFSK